MIVQLVIKAIIFYFIFLGIRGLLRAVGSIKQFNEVKDNIKNNFHGPSDNSGANHYQKAQSKSDPNTVEADFRRL